MADKRPVVANMDFDDIKQDMIDYFSNQDDLKDLNFTGSALNTLIDILAYNTHYNALTANFAMNETFLDTAIVRDNVVSLAKTLNYQPRSITASKTEIKLNISKTGNETFFAIPAGTAFTAQEGNTTYNFFTISDNTVQFEESLSSNDITVTAYEGSIISQRFVSSAVTGQASFELLNQNIDTQTIVVSVNGDKWQMVTPEIEGTTAVTKDSKIFFVEEIVDSKHKIVFGNGKVGKAIEANDEIIVTYIVTNGAEANGISSFTASISGKQTSEYSVLSAEKSYGGSAAETVQEIKTNAPKFFQSQFRAVTTNDYETILKKNFADIESINVFGGETIGKPGKVFLTIKPKSGDKLSDSVKDNIKSNILDKYNVVTISPEILDPEFVEVVVDTNIIYDNSKLTTNEFNLKSKTIRLYDSFNKTNLNNFGDSFYMSNLTAEINDLDDSIVSSNNRVKLKYINKSTNGILTYKFTYGNRIYHPFDGYKADQGGVFNTNEFTIKGSAVKSVMEDNGYGKLVIYNIENGIKVLRNAAAGTINYETGEIDIEDFVTSDDQITFTAIPDSFDITSSNNNLLRISSSDSTVRVIEVSNSAAIQQLSRSRSE